MMRRITLLLWCALVAPPAFGQTTLNGAGATFPYPIYSKWFSEYHKLHPDIQINYQSIGSGGGIRQVIAGTVDFGASDGPMTDDQLKEAKIKILHAPTVLGADVPAYNFKTLIAVHRRVGIPEFAQQHRPARRIAEFTRQPEKQSRASEHTKLSKHQK